MIILGIDPGFARLGYALLNKEGQTLKLLNVGCLETKSGGENAGRLQFLANELKKIIGEYKPNLCAIEKLFFFKNQKTVIQVAEARGMILAQFADNDVPYVEFTPMEVKQALTGYGRATKDQVQKMLMQVFKLKMMIEPDDAADAVAVAYAAAVSGK